MSKIPEYEKRRADFIIEMYRVYWANMARSMEGVWKILAPITVAGTIIAAVHKEYLPAPLGISLAFLVIIWALNMTIDLNAWHRRNLFLLTKTEHQFLRSQDYGKLLPKKYKKPESKWITVYAINLIVFFTFLILIIIYFVFWKWLINHDTDNLLMPLVVLIVGIILTIVNAVVQGKSSKKHFNELLGSEQREKERKWRGFLKCISKKIFQRPIR